MNTPDPHAAADAAFTSYFRAQMPARFPTAPIPVDAAPKLPTRGNPWRTRLTLAASVAALLVFGFTFSYGPATQSQPKGEIINNPTAGPNGKVKGLADHIPKDDKIDVIP